jgi:hypothetical protein
VVPSVGVAGGIGDKLILYVGAASVYPYPLEINTNALWYSVPSAASHKFYDNGGNTLIIDSSGKVNSGSQTPSYILQVGDSARLRI